MADNNDDFGEVIGGIFALVIAVVIGILLFKGTMGVVHWFQTQSKKSWVCTENVKVISTRPYYEDNGKYEDEAYEVTYEDGSKGIIPNPESVEDGYYCRKSEFK